jgi:hypothetical protein
VLDPNVVAKLEVRIIKKDVLTFDNGLSVFFRKKEGWYYAYEVETKLQLSSHPDKAKLMNFINKVKDEARDIRDQYLSSTSIQTESL